MREFARCALLFTACLSLALVYGCSSELNPNNLPPYDINGLVDMSHLKAFYQMEQPTSIRVYVESSGSMNGLFRRNKPTGFKRNMSAMLEHAPIKKVLSAVEVFDNNGLSTTSYTAKVFREKMNQGAFDSKKSTIVPNMIDRILGDIDSAYCDVAIMISDMKYSPVGQGYATKMDQYEIDIKSRFADRSQLAVSMIGCESDFLSVNGMSLCDEFPYYLIIMGDTREVAWVRNEILTAFSDTGRVMGILEFNMDYGCPRYTALPGTAMGMAQNNNELLSEYAAEHSSSFTAFDCSMQPAEVMLAIDYGYLPTTILNALDESCFEVTSYLNDIKATISILPDYRPTVNSVLVNKLHPNIYLRLSMNGLDAFESDVISIRLVDNLAVDTGWVCKYYNAQAESDLPKTLSLDAFIKGLKVAYSDANHLQNTSMSLFVTKKI